ncbi:unnamed protein product [Acanthoscelides obtectus]|uniref:Uncharacterized protein n=1 Tax=Acanthoscelides obtectus TaxID=200917 RepID=A0A9P0KMU0_ACAOB|nr:unnamed protein product [Acanthoscelides obtectus]CAK1682034.1 hypothetical protein AOBTE_LOCUS33390 [Acanthoscelides obtectus]
MTMTTRSHNILITLVDTVSSSNQGSGISDFFYHYLDMTIVNAWLLYRRVNDQKGDTKTLGLANFRIDLGETLCKIGIRQNSRGRKSDLEKKIQQKQRSRNCPIPRREEDTENTWAGKF